MYIFEKLPAKGAIETEILRAAAPVSLRSVLGPALMVGYAPPMLLALSLLAVQLVIDIGAVASVVIDRVSCFLRRRSRGPRPMPARCALKTPRRPAASRHTAAATPGAPRPAPHARMAALAASLPGRGGGASGRGASEAMAHAISRHHLEALLILWYRACGQCCICPGKRKCMWGGPHVTSVDVAETPNTTGGSLGMWPSNTLASAVQ